MAVYTTARAVDVSSLGFPAVMRASSAAGTWTVEAEVPLATLQAAVDAAPDDPAPVRTANADDLRAKGLAYLALASPTQAQTTKAVRALVMLALNALDDTTGT